MRNQVHHLRETQSLIPSEIVIPTASGRSSASASKAGHYQNPLRLLWEAALGARRMKRIKVESRNTNHACVPVPRRFRITINVGTSLTLHLCRIRIRLLIKGRAMLSIPRPHFIEL